MKHITRDKLSGYVFIIPAVALILLFNVIAMGGSLYISLTKWNLLSPQKTFVGLENFKRALNDPIVWISFKNTAFYAFFMVLMTTLLSLFLAVLVDKFFKKGAAILKTSYYIPSITPMVAISFIWLWLYLPMGIINTILGLFSLPQPNWLMNTSLAMPAIIIMSVWKTTGYYMVIFLAGLNDIPKVFYDAAKVDGAGGIQVFWSITLPLLKNTLIFVLVMLTITSFQVFTPVYVMTRGGPGRSTEVVSAVVYKQGFKFLHMGYAASIAWLLFGAIFTLVVFQTKRYISQQMY